MLLVRTPAYPWALYQDKTVFFFPGGQDCWCCSENLLYFAVVDNLPQVGPEKQDKLTAVIKKIFGQVGIIREGWGPLLGYEHRNTC